MTAAFLACGIDPKKHIVFNQSQVAEHAELAWVFNCVARLGWLNRMTQFKEKAGKDRENASVGLYAYPNLMAADILVYRATHVPVGEDQKQHLELARDIAQKFNNDFAPSIHAHGYGEAFFPQPEPIIQGPATRVMSLRDGSKKMSKSDASDYSRINLTDDADAIAQKIRKAKTDPEPLPSEEKGLETAARGRQPRRHLCGAQGDTTKAQVLSEFGGGQFSAFKTGAGRSLCRQTRADRRRDEEACRRIRSISTRCWPTALQRAQVDRRRHHEGCQGHRRLRAALMSALVSAGDAVPPLPPCASVPDRGRMTRGQ